MRLEVIRMFSRQLRLEMSDTFFQLPNIPDYALADGRLVAFTGEIGRTQDPSSYEVLVRMVGILRQQTRNCRMAVHLVHWLQVRMTSPVG